MQAILASELTQNAGMSNILPPIYWGCVAFVGLAAIYAMFCAMSHRRERRRGIDAISPFEVYLLWIVALIGVREW